MKDNIIDNIINYKDNFLSMYTVGTIRYNPNCSHACNVFNSFGKGTYVNQAM